MKTINLPPISELGGVEYLVITQAGESYRVSMSQLMALANSALPDGGRWFIANIDPTSDVGITGDFAINVIGSEFFYKTDLSTWVSGGPIGGVQDAPKDGRVYFRQGETWVPAVRFAMAVGVTVANLDLAVKQAYQIDATVDRTLAFVNAPDSTVAMSVTIDFTGSGGIVTWPAGILWSAGTVPTFGATFTVVILFWTGARWIGNVVAVG